MAEYRTDTDGVQIFHDDGDALKVVATATGGNAAALLAELNRPITASQCAELAEIVNSLNLDDLSWEQAKYLGEAGERRSVQRIVEIVHSALTD